MNSHPVNRRWVEQATLGERAAEAMQRRIGSWPFLIGQSIFLVCWIVLNVVAVVEHWDPYPFILLNLMLSFQAAYTGPILLIASNRSQTHDRPIADATFTDTEILKRLLEENTRLTESVHQLTQELHEHLLQVRAETEIRAAVQTADNASPPA
jgi:uncharacterized membrane protein